MRNIFIHNAIIVNEGVSYIGDVLIRKGVIDFVGRLNDIPLPPDTDVIEASGLYLLPGVIDSHVHFREPGLTQKADIWSESRAAVAGGVTSFMEMPNTNPQTVTTEALNNKYQLGADKSIANYSFYIGATNDNLDEVMKVDPSTVCGIKLFMGSSTGNMLVNDIQALEELFKNARLPIVAHCEDEEIIRKNCEYYKQQYGDAVPISMHPLIRSREACYKSSSKAVGLALKHDAQLHILHVTSADELKLFSNHISLKEKKITAEACIEHLWFDDSFYDTLGTFMKVNPAVKTRFDRQAILDGVCNNLIDTISTDHAPHTLREKDNSYFKAPSGVPSIQHSLTAMLELWHDNLISIEKIVEKMCHNQATIFKIKDRGFIREGFKADLCLVNANRDWQINETNVLHKCGWSAFPRGTNFHTKVVKTIINGNVVFDNDIFDESYRGERLTFNRL